MKCNRCKNNEADIFIGYLKQNRNNTVSLCEICSKNMGISDQLMDHQSYIDYHEPHRVSIADSELICPQCSTKIGHFLSTGQIGCPDCYLVFKSEIDEYFHIRSEKQPSSHLLSGLSLELENALVDENYEYAATLRDRINFLSFGKVNEFIEN